MADAAECRPQQAEKRNLPWHRTSYGRTVGDAMNLRLRTIVGILKAAAIIGTVIIAIIIAAKLGVI